jgi:hypothetical protein
LFWIPTTYLAFLCAETALESFFCLLWIPEATVLMPVLLVALVLSLDAVLAHVRKSVHTCQLIFPHGLEEITISESTRNNYALLPHAVQLS